MVVVVVVLRWFAAGQFESAGLALSMTVVDRKAGIVGEAHLRASLHGQCSPRAPRGPYGTGARNTSPPFHIPSIGRLFGAETESRVRAFQRRNMLVPDGIVGPQELGGT